MDGGQEGLSCSHGVNSQRGRGDQKRSRAWMVDRRGSLVVTESKGRGDQKRSRVADGGQEGASAPCHGMLVASRGAEDSGWGS